MKSQLTTKDWAALLLGLICLIASCYMLINAYRPLLWSQTTATIESVDLIPAIQAGDETRLTIHYRFEADGREIIGQRVNPCMEIA
ncbi:hypothetical protein [Dongshaea marina]|uniref:hypothetical protein n=1 Tax=Dongshaea marina TaxID=2047966 RepID=UPI000D3E5500|nr:hypothetical protein [Dongshaea marina]